MEHWGLISIRQGDNEHRYDQQYFKLCPSVFVLIVWRIMICYYILCI